MRFSLFAVSLLSISLAACGAPADDAAPVENSAADTDAGDSGASEMPQQASAPLFDADGNEVGVAIAMTTDDGVSLNIMADGITPGSHGAHIHEVGTCEPDFVASGEHWAPFDAALNLADDDPSNDSENATIEVRSDGTGEREYALGGDVTLEGILEGDGSAFVIHTRDVEPTMDTPSGEGDRIACGVFAAGS